MSFLPTGRLCPCREFQRSSRRRFFRESGNIHPDQFKRPLVDLISPAIQGSGGIAGAVESFASSAVSSAASSVVGAASSVVSPAAETKISGGIPVTGNNATVDSNSTAKGVANATNGTNGTSGALGLRSHITSGKEVIGFGLMAAGVYAGLSFL